MKTYPAIYFRSNHNYNFVYPQEIVHIKSEGSYSILTIGEDKKLTVSKKLKDIASTLPQDLFVRVHNCDVVNLMHVRGIGGEGGDEISLSNNTKVKLSRRKKQDFMARFIQI